MRWFKKLKKCYQSFKHKGLHMERGLVYLRVLSLMVSCFSLENTKLANLCVLAYQGDTDTPLKSFLTHHFIRHVVYRLHVPAICILKRIRELANFVRQRACCDFSGYDRICKSENGYAASGG